MQNNIISSKSERDQSIDLVKIIAMLMVLLLHTGLVRGFCGYTTVLETYFIGGIAIPLFFMTSGYLMVNKDSSIKYRIRKAAGILLFVFLTCLIWTLWDTLRGRTTDFISTLSHIYILSFFQKGPFFVFWYFGAMILIYAVLPIIHRIIYGKYFLISLVSLLCLCTIICTLNVKFLFEKKYVIQTFRIWYWIFYFMLGAYVRLNQRKFSKIRGWQAFLACIVFVFFGRLVSGGGIEYLFGSIPCVIYALLAFSSCINFKVQNSLVIKNLSQCFLPVYAWHMFVLDKLFKYLPVNLIEASLPPILAIFLEFIFAAAIIVSLSLILIRIPFINKLFRI